MRKSHAFLSVGGGLLLVLLLAAPLSSLSLTATATAVPTGDLPDWCATEVECSAYQAPPGSNQFGPDQLGHDLTVVTARFVHNVCSDPADAAVVKDVVDKDLEGASTPEIEALAATYVADHAKWLADVEDTMSQVVKFTVRYESADTYESMGMVVSGTDTSVIPSVVKTEWNRPIGWALIAHLKDGTTRIFRIVCDLQPSGPEIPGVPTAPTPPSTTPPATPPSVPPSTPPTTPPTTPPPCVLGPKPPDDQNLYEPSADGCSWVLVGPNLDRGPQAQPVQQDRGGQSTAQSQPADVPSTAPAPKPTATAPATQPNESGYVPASGTAPGGSSSEPDGSTVVAPPETGTPVCDPSLGCGTAPTGAPAPPD